MLFQGSLETADVLAVFEDETTAQGGTIRDTFDDGRRLFARSVFPRIEDVRPGDRFRGGVALKATSEGIWLCPYLFRLVCKNGAVMAETLNSQFLGDLEEQEPETALNSIREGIRACGAPEVFMDTVHRVRRACDVRLDAPLRSLLQLTSLSSGGRHTVLRRQIMDRFFREEDRSHFGLANAVTAVARDMRDPDLRWNLEELGGRIAVVSVFRQPASEADERIIEGRTAEVG
jgi:hypothetical protein